MMPRRQYLIHSGDWTQISGVVKEIKCDSSVFSCLRFDTVHRTKQVLILDDIFADSDHLVDTLTHEVVRRILGVHSFFLFLFFVSTSQEDFFGKSAETAMFVVFHVGKVADVYNGKYSNKVFIVPFEPELISLKRKKKQLQQH